jgi:methylglyoxal synthase
LKPKRKRIALIAHDRLKPALVAWARRHLDFLRHHDLCATGTTGARIEQELGLKLERFLSGPKGGDQQVGARIAEGRIDMVVFFWDPLEPQPHDVDVKALLRIAVLHDIPIANNPATADLLVDHSS